TMTTEYKCIELLGFRIPVLEVLNLLNTTIDSFEWSHVIFGQMIALALFFPAPFSLFICWSNLFHALLFYLLFSLAGVSSRCFHSLFQREKGGKNEKTLQ